MEIITGRINQELQEQSISMAELGRRMQPPMSKQQVHNLLRRGSPMSFSMADRMLLPLGLTLNVEIQVIEKK